ncbi:uridine kinase [bacterium]|nr:uridine kinase [bacterium]
MLRDVAGAIVAVKRSHPVRVAVDGIGVAGKTVFADALALEVERLGRPVVRMSIDGFHNPAHVRRRQGEFSALGYYEDSFDYDAFRTHVLIPLGAQGVRRFRRAVYDFRSDLPIEVPEEGLAEKAVAICDGIFLMRPEINEYWDFRVFLDVGFEVALNRALTRDLELFGSEDAVRERYGKRYTPGEQHYLNVVAPAELADVVVDNNDFLNPRVQWCTKRYM